MEVKTGLSKVKVPLDPMVSMHMNKEYGVSDMMFIVHYIMVVESQRRLHVHIYMYMYPTLHKALNSLCSTLTICHT